MKITRIANILLATFVLFVPHDLWGQLHAADFTAFPKVEFVSEPQLDHDHIKASVVLSNPRNQFARINVVLEGLESTDGVDHIEEIATLGQAVVSAINDSAEVQKSSGLTFNHDLASSKFDRPKTQAVRLRITAMQGATHPKDWTEVKAIVLFSKWLQLTKSQ